MWSSNTCELWYIPGVVLTYGFNFCFYLSMFGTNFFINIFGDWYRFLGILYCVKTFYVFQLGISCRNEFLYLFWWICKYMQKATKKLFFFFLSYYSYYLWGWSFFSFIRLASLTEDVKKELEDPNSRYYSPCLLISQFFNGYLSFTTDSKKIILSFCLKLLVLMI